MTKTLLSDADVARLVPPLRGKFVVWDAGYSHQVFDAAGQPTYQSSYARGDGRLGVLVTAKGHKSWVFRYWHKGRARWVTIGSAKNIKVEDARFKALVLIDKVRFGRDPQGELMDARKRGMAPDPKPETFALLLQRFLDEHCEGLRSKGTIELLLTKHALPTLGDRPVRDITRANIQTVVDAIKARASANQTRAYLSSAFAFAVRKQLCDANPVHDVTRHKTKPRTRVLSDDELVRFWRAWEQRKLVVLMTALLLGQRIGEISHMRWEHIDASWWWRLPSEPQPHLQWRGTKNAKPHAVFLSPEVRALLGPRRGKGFVFPPPRVNLDAIMRAISAELGVEPNVTCHDLRRTFSTWVVRLGFGRDGMHRTTNHKSGNALEAVYDQFDYADANRRIWESTAREILRLVGGEAASNVIALR